MIVTVSDKTFDIVINEQQGKFIAVVDGKQVDVIPEIDKNGQVIGIAVDNKKYNVSIKEIKGKYAVSVTRNQFSALIDKTSDKTEDLTKSDSSNIIHSPMSGLVVALHKKQGDIVNKGESLLVLEAMKMQNDIHSPINAKVSEVYVKVGQTVEKDEKLMVLEPL